MAERTPARSLRPAEASDRVRRTTTPHVAYMARLAAWRPGCTSGWTNDGVRGADGRGPMRRILSGVVIVSLAGGLAASGCTAVEQNPKTALGAGVGAAGGAVVGGLAGRGTTGAVVGGLLGALAGGAVGQYLDRKDKDRSQAAADTSYTPSQGNFVDVTPVEAQPAQVRPGGSVNLQATYTVLTPDPNQTVTVQETREVRYNGQVVANTSGNFSRPNGTYTSSLPITLPPSAGRGTYQVTTTVAMADKQGQGTTTFVVQ